MEGMRIIAAGDAALVLELPSRIDASVTAWLVFIADRMRGRLGAAVRDAVVGYCTLTVYFDPVLTDPAWLEQELRIIASEESQTSTAQGALIDIPVCYGGVCGPDLVSVAYLIGATPDEVIDLHCSPEYRVF